MVPIAPFYEEETGQVGGGAVSLGFGGASSGAAGPAGGAAAEGAPPSVEGIMQRRYSRDFANMFTGVANKG